MKSKNVQKEGVIPVQKCHYYRDQPASRYTTPTAPSVSEAEPPNFSLCVEISITLLLLAYSHTYSTFQQRLPLSLSSDVRWYKIMRW